MSGTPKRVVSGFRLPWADVRLVGSTMTAPGKAWDGGPWIETPGIPAFEPDTEAAAQWVNWLASTHDNNDLRLAADAVHRDFSQAGAYNAPVNFAFRQMVWDPIRLQWLLVGRNTTTTNKAMLALKRHALTLVDITPASVTGGPAPTGTWHGVGVPKDLREADAFGASSYLAMGLTLGGTLELWRVQMSTGASEVVSITTPPSGAGTYFTGDASYIGKEGIDGPYHAWCALRNDGSFHIFHAPAVYVTPTTDTIDWAPGTITAGTCRFRFLRPIDEELNSGDTDMIVQLHAWSVANEHKVFCRRYSAGTPTWTKYDEPFAAAIPSGDQGTIIGMAYEPRLGNWIAAIYVKPPSTTPGLRFFFFDPQSGNVQDLALPIVSPWEVAHYKETQITVNGASQVHPTSFDVYNDAWVIMVGGNGANTQPIWSFDFGASWHAEPSATIAGSGGYIEGTDPGSFAPMSAVGGRGFAYGVPTQVTVASGSHAIAATPFGGTIAGPMTENS